MRASEHFWFRHSFCLLFVLTSCTVVAEAKRNPSSHANHIQAQASATTESDQEWLAHYTMPQTLDTLQKAHKNGIDFGYTAESAQEWLAQHSSRPLPSTEYQRRNAEFAMLARQHLPLTAGNVSEDIWLQWVLPYQHFDEPLDEWRPFFFKQLYEIPGVQASRDLKTLAEQVIPLSFFGLGTEVEFKANFTPQAMAPISETLAFGHASCTGLSILVANALRSVGVPARIVGVPEWNQPEGGNHNWVEVWTGEEWHFIDAVPTHQVTWDQAWFADGLVQKSIPNGMHGVSTPVWNAADGDTDYTVTWRDPHVSLRAIDRTEFYKNISLPSSAPEAQEAVKEAQEKEEQEAVKKAQEAAGPTIGGPRPRPP